MILQLENGAERRIPAEKLKGCDFGYGLAASSCEGVDNVDACTVTAPDAIAAFAVPNPNWISRIRVGFFGSGRLTSCPASRITQSTLD